MKNNYYDIIAVELISSSHYNFFQVTKGNQLRKQREVTLVKFLRLLFYRLIFGFANMIGMGEAAENVGDGVLAPPDSDYRGEDNGDVDYSYDYSNDDYDSFEF